MSNYVLKVVSGKVKYINVHNGSAVGSDTPVDSAMWLLRNGKPEKSDKFEGYPIGLMMADKSGYYFAGEWLMGGDVDVLSDDAQNGASSLGEAQNGQSASCGPDYCEIEEKPRASRKRRTKDIVLE